MLSAFHENVTPNGISDDVTLTSVPGNITSRDVPRVFTHPALTVLIVVVTLAIVVANVINIVVISTTKSLQNPSGHLMISLAIGDLLMGLVVTPSSIGASRYGYWPYGQVFCFFSGYVALLVMCTSIWTLAIISLNRWIHVSRPLQYETIVTRRRCFAAILLVWVGNALPPLISPMFGWGSIRYDRYVFFCMFDFNNEPAYTLFTTSIVIGSAGPLLVYTYVKMFMIARGHLQQIRQLEITTNIDSNRKGLLVAQMNGIKTIGIIVISFYIVWSPATLLSLISSLAVHEDTIHQGVHFVCWWLAICNSFMNFFIYSVRNAAFRDQLMRLKQKLCHKATINPIEA